MSSSQTPTNSQTYEAAKARRFTDRQPDKIHWDGDAAFREEPYRQLHHQNGVIGTFNVRLLEASDLKRSYWSPLALGPVKLLGLSKAHGDVSSYCTFSLGFHDHRRPCYGRSPVVSSGNLKPAAEPTNNQQNPVDNGLECKSSPVVERSNNPVWDNCVLELPLRKGAADADGLCVHLNVRVDEEATAVENFIPGIIPMGNQGDRLLGIGQLDLTELLRGETNEGIAVPGVRDEWVPITLKVNRTENERNLEQLQYHKNDPLAPPVASLSQGYFVTPNDGITSQQSEQDSSSDTTITGMVRVLISYHTNGLEPEPNDIVALESFARHDPSVSSCNPLLPPLQPLTVIDRRGPYLLCEYSLRALNKRNSRPPSGNSRNKSNHRCKACVRLHRNAVFVIERQNILDAAHNLVLLPIDAALATPLGQAACTALAPVISAGSEILMPTLLSLKLLWMASRATAVASMSGVHALTSTLWREGSSSLLHNHNQQSRADGRGRQREDNRSGGAAQFVKL